MKIIDVIALVLVIVGAINWGLIGFFGFNLVSAIFGEATVLSRIIYGLVGISGIYAAVAIKSMLSHWCPVPSRTS
ncbi:MAG: DUF378 domain-containing protein [Desulfovibrionales bacterium]